MISHFSSKLFLGVSKVKKLVFTSSLSFIQFFSEETSSAA